MEEKPVKLAVSMNKLCVGSDSGSPMGETRWLLSGNRGESVETAGGKHESACEQVLSVVQLAAASFFCLMWNIAGVLITLHFCRSSANDKARQLAVVLMSVPILGMGSLLTWFVLCEWCNQVRVLRRRAWNAPAGDMP